MNRDVFTELSVYCFRAGWYIAKRFYMNTFFQPFLQCQNFCGTLPSFSTSLIWVPVMLRCVFRNHTQILQCCHWIEIANSSTNMQLVRIIILPTRIYPFVFRWCSCLIDLDCHLLQKILCEIISKPQNNSQIRQRDGFHYIPSATINVANPSRYDCRTVFTCKYSYALQNRIPYKSPKRKRVQ